MRNTAAQELGPDARGLVRCPCQGEALDGGLAADADRTLSRSTNSRTTMRGMLHRSSWRALGTSTHLLIHGPEGSDLDRAQAATERVLVDIDRSLSRFRTDSELAVVNGAAPRWARVSPLFVQALDLALEVARETLGAVDPTVGRAMRVIGYDDDFGRIGSRSGPALRVAPAAGWRAIDLDRDRRMVRLPRGVELDLGATGKALAADLAARAALGALRGASGSVGVLVSLGGDIATAGRAPDGGWRVLVAEDSNLPPDGDGEVIALGRGAVATSSTTVRRWLTPDGASRHHLVDPATGSSVESPWRTVSVVADRCVEANGAATAAIVLADSGLDWLRRRGLAARLVAADGRVMRIGGWPEPEAAPGATPARAAHGGLLAHG